MPDKKHNFTRLEILSGLLVLMSFVILAGFMALIQGYRPQHESYTYTTNFTNIIGLKNGAEVRFAGMLAGRVTTITPHPEDQSQIQITLDVKPDTPINAASIATIETLSLTAEKHLEVSSGETDAPRLKPGDTINSITKSGAFIEIPDMDGLVGGGEDLIGDLRELLGVEEALEQEAAGEYEMASVTRLTADLRMFLGIQAALQEQAENGGDLPSLTTITKDVRELLGVEEGRTAEEAGEAEFTSLADILNDVDGLFATYEPQLTEILAGVDPILTNTDTLLVEVNDLLKDNRQNIDSAITGLDDLITKLNKELGAMADALKSTLENTDGLTSELAELIENNRPVLEDMINELDSTLLNLDAFMQLLKNQPQSVLWGKPINGRR